MASGWGRLLGVSANEKWGILTSSGACGLPSRPSPCEKKEENHDLRVSGMLRSAAQVRVRVRWCPVGGVRGGRNKGRQQHVRSLATLVTCSASICSWLRVSPAQNSGLPLYPPAVSL